MSAVSQWRPRAPYLGEHQLPGPLALTIDRRTPLPEPPTRRVRALSATWRFNGRQVNEGETYDLPADIAEGLVHVGKAAFA